MRQFAFLFVIFSTFSAAAFGQCSFTVNPSAQAYTDSLGYIDTGHDPLVIQITASAQACAWTADKSDGFATIPGAISGTGNGSVTYSVPANTTGAARSVVLNIAGNAVTLTQKATASTFADEPLNDPFFDGINLMRTNNITLGCSAAPLSYCPNTNVTRDQMAVFIVRTILGGGPNVDNFQYSSTPYFTDVPPTYQFFKWIQKMRELGITSGTTATTYGPLLPVTRGQMAVFIVRARLGTSTVFTYNPTPYFTDVPANYQFFKWVQKLKEIGITSGTTATTYSPDGVVTRGQMAVFLIRAGFNTLLNPALPLITSAAPNSGAPGTSVNIAVTGINTHFASDTTILADSGVTGSKVVATDATHLTATLTIPAGTALGQISITAETLSASEEATLPNGFTIGSGDPIPTITSFTPASGPIGTSVTLTGTTLVSSLGTPVSVLVPLQGGGITGAPVEASSATSITFVIPSTAATGKITLSSSSGTVTSANAFTVVPSSTYTISATPAATNVIAGQTATYTVTASSTTGFAGLAQLSVSGLPSGVTAAFSPAQISVGQQSTLTVTAPANQTTNTANLAIGANATVDGMAVPAATTVTLNVTPISTSFIGRTVVDDGTNTSLAGVTVTMVGQNGSGSATACTGSTTSDGSGNFALTNLPPTCLGPQLVGFIGNHVTSPAGTYAGLQLVFTLVSGQVVVSPVLVHLPRVDNVETFQVKQNAPTDQSYTFKSIPGLSVTVYAGTVFTEQDNSQPDPFPLAAIQVPVDRLPDVMPVTSASVTVFIVAFQPAETNASKAVAVWFPNSLNSPPGTDMPLMTLDPTLGRMAPYGTGTVSNDGTTIIPDIDPSTGTLYHRFGIVHFDWHGPANNAAPGVSPSADGGGAGHESTCPCSGDPVDLSSGVQTLTSTDLVLTGGRGTVAITRTYVTFDTQLRLFGFGSSFSYDYRLDAILPQSVAMINLELPNGVRIPFSRIQDGTLVNQTVPSFAGAVMTTSASGSTTLRLKNGIFYQFQPGNQGSVLVATGDSNGNVITIVRDTSSFLTPINEIDDPVGRKLVFTHDGNGLITSITDPLGRKVSYTYDDGGFLVTFTNTLGGVTNYSYEFLGFDNNHLKIERLTSVTDPDGVVRMQNTYDANGRVIQQVTPGGGSLKFAYTLVNSLVPTSPVQQTQETDPNGNITTYRFNSAGFVATVTDPLGQTRTFDRQSGTNYLLGLHGPGTCSVCGAGDVTFTYDGNGNVTSQTDALGGVASFVYDPVFNHLTSLTDPLGNVSGFTYDLQGNLTSMTDARNHAVTLTHDSHGLLTSVRNATGQLVTFGWDSQGNQIRATNPAGQITSSVYDAVSRLTAYVDPLGNQTSLAYTPFDEVASAIDGNGNKTAVTYDLTGRPLTYTDAHGGTVTLAYDRAGRLSTRKDQQNQVSTISYDLNNNIVSTVSRRGQQANFVYDTLDRLITQQYADATVSFGYNTAGLLARAVDSASGTFEMAYDLVGRLIKSTGPFGAVTYTRDAAGQVVSRQVTGAPEVDYTYDAVQNLASAGTTGASISFTYDSNDNPLTTSRSNGVGGKYGFDAEGRLVSLAEQSGSTNILSRSMSYDPAGRLTTQTVEAGQSLPLLTSASGFNISNQLATGAGSVFTYDSAGNRLTEVSAAGTTSYVWDARGRLQAISSPGGVITAFLYDFGGNMIQKRVTSAGNDSVERYVLDEFSNVVQQQLAGAGAVNLLTGQSPDQNFATISGGSSVFGIVDYNGSVVALTDGSGALTSRINYGPWGDTSASPGAYPAEYTGRQQVASSLYYLHARYLDSRNGNFLSEDPEGIASGDANLYRYGYGDPIDMRDPSGTLPIFVVTAALGGLVGGTSSALGTVVTNAWDHEPLLQGFDPQDVANAAQSGAVTGFFAPFTIRNTLAAVTASVLGNMMQSALQDYHKGVSIACGQAWAVVGGVVGGFISGAPGGKYISHAVLEDLGPELAEAFREGIDKVNTASFLRQNLTLTNLFRGLAGGTVSNLSQPVPFKASGPPIPGGRTMPPYRNRQ